ncbi:hypothetical protein BGX23_007719 [Mortierella sp. AD031]|nr:hypothetical protein BGX23_007719 [Mortierella sp. AD031]
MFFFKQSSVRLFVSLATILRATCLLAPLNAANFVEGLYTIKGVPLRTLYVESNADPYYSYVLVSQNPPTGVSTAWQVIFQFEIRSVVGSGSGGSDAVRYKIWAAGSLAAHAVYE